MVADVIARLRTFGLYQDNDNEEVHLSLEGTLKNIIEEIHHIHSIPEPQHTLKRAVMRQLPHKESQRNQS